MEEFVPAVVFVINGGVRFNGSYSTISYNHGINFEIAVSNDVSFIFDNTMIGMPQVWMSSTILDSGFHVYSMFSNGSINHPTSGGLTDYQRYQRPALSYPKSDILT